MTNMEVLSRLIDELPKAELHVHVEGTLLPERLFALAQKNKISIPYHSVEEVRAAYKFADLQSFLDLYYQGMSVLLHESDYVDLAMDCGEMFHEHGVTYAEIFFDPQGHLCRGVAIHTVVEGLEKGFAQIYEKYKITVKIIFSFLRHLSEEECLALVQDTDSPTGKYIRACFEQGRFLGVGLDSSELGHPPEKFTNLFHYCRSVLKAPYVVVHAGEEGPPAYIRAALKQLHADRVDHGVASIQDAELLKELSAKQTPLTVCPTSNVALKVFPSDEACADVVLDLLQTHRLCVMLNSDDPAYFGGGVKESYKMLLTKPDRVTADTILKLVENSWKATFLSEEEKKERLAVVGRVYDEVCAGHASS